MPSSFSFLLNSQSNNSSSASKNDSKSDQSDDDDDDDDINVKCYKKRTIQNDNDMLERPSDHDDSCSQSDVTDEDDDDDDDDDTKKKDRFTSSNNNRSVFLTRQATLYDDNWPKKSSTGDNQLKKVINNSEAILLETERNDSLSFNFNPDRSFSSERNKSGGIADKKYQSHNVHTPLPSDFKMSTHERHSIPKPGTMKTTLPVPQTKSSSTTSSTTNQNTRRSLSKIPVRTNSSSQSRSRSPTTAAAKNCRIHSPTTASKIPVPVSTTSKGAFRFFTSADRSGTSKLPPASKDSIQTSNKTSAQVSPFTPITHRKVFSAPDKTTSSAGNTPLAKHRRSALAVSDEEDGEDAESDINNLKEDDLKLKLKEQKQYGKKTGELLNKLHENYEELLEKYAQAENTIDQLRFQPKIVGDRTPSSNASEGTIHFIHQPKVNAATLHSNGIYRSSVDTPFSSIMQVPSSATTTSTTPAIKSVSPTNSVTVESVFFDESVPQKIIVQELTTPENVKLDLLIQTKTLGGKMKSFLTLMDANQLSLAEQKQVYDTIKEDYEKLLKVFDRSKSGSDFSDVDFDADLNTELETMKQLLKEIVTRITDNLLGKSSNRSESDRQSRGTQSEGHSSQISARSSLCNHADLMDQYNKLLSAVNQGILEKRNVVRSPHTRLENGLEHAKTTYSHDTSHLDLSDHVPSTTKTQKQQIYLSGNSDDEQQRNQRSTPIQLKKGIESTPYDLDLNPLTSNNHHQQIDERHAHTHDLTAAKKKRSPIQQEIQEYDNLENVTRPQRKAKAEQRKMTNAYERDSALSPASFSNALGGTHYSTRSMRTRTSDYDSGIGTNNTTKLSRDSKLNTSMIDESHYQSLDEDRRRYTDEEQETISNLSSPPSRSSGSGAANLGVSYDKYTKRFDTLSSLKSHQENYRREPTGQSEFYPSDIETYITDSFDPTLQHTPEYTRKSRHSHPNLQTHQTSSHRSRSTPYHRSLSTESIDQNNYTTSSRRPHTAPQEASKLADQDRQMGRKYRSGLVHRQATPSSTNPEKMYRSACYIEEPHTHRRSQDKLDQNHRQYPKQVSATTRKETTHLYLDSHTGTVYRYVPNKNQTSTAPYYQPTSQVKSSTKLFQCADCGCMTTYHHRHHMHSIVRRIGNDIEDPGYESGHRKLHRHRQYLDSTISSDSDSEENATLVDMGLLNEAYERAQKVQYRSQTLSRHISRQLKLILATI